FTNFFALLGVLFITGIFSSYILQAITIASIYFFTNFFALLGVLFITGIFSSYILQAITIASIYFFTNFFALLGVLFITGIFSTLRSGSSEAWVIDLLKHKKQSKLTNKFFSKKWILFSLAFVLSGLIGSLVVSKFSLKMIWPVSGFSLLIASLILSFGQEHYKKPKQTEKKKKILKESIKDVWNQSKQTIIYSYRKKSFLYILIIVFIVALAGGLRSLIVWTPFLQNFGFSNSWFGYLWSLMALTGVVAPLISSKLSDKYKEKKLLITISIMTLIFGIFVLFTSNLIYAILIVLISSFLFDLRMPISRTFFHKHVNSKLRETSGSVEGMLLSLAGIISLPIAGLLIDSIGAKTTVFISTLFMIPVIFIYLKIK
ncbi:MAG: MFS transporter, partial [bacterium]